MSAGADRVRKWRARLAEGKRYYPACLDEVAVEAKLEKAGFLKPTICERKPGEVDAAYQQFQSFLFETEE